MNKQEQINEVMKATEAKLIAIINSTGEPPVTDWRQQIMYGEKLDRLRIKQQLLNDMEYFADYFNAGEVVDWNKPSRGKFGIIDEVTELRICRTNIVNNLKFGIAVLTQEHAKLMLKEFGDRINKMGI